MKLLFHYFGEISFKITFVTLHILHNLFLYFHGISVLSNDILFFLSNELNESRIFSWRLYKNMVCFLLSYYFLSPTCHIYFFILSFYLIQHKTSCSQQFFICLLRLTSSVQLKCWMGYHARVVDPGKYYPDPAPSLEENRIQMRP